MIRCIHTADYHLGVDTLGPTDRDTGLNSRVLDYLDTLDAVVDYADDNRPDLFLIAGDLFHKRNPDTTYVELLTRRLMRLAAICPIVIIPGNHDMPGIAEKAGVVDLYDTLQLSNIIVAKEPAVLDIGTASGPVQIACMPYPMRQRYLNAAELRKSNANEIWKAKIAATIQELLAGLQPGVPAIFMGHFSVNAAQWGSERLMLVGNDAEVMLDDLMSPALDYVALGHLHVYQDIGSPDLPVVYPGSLERVDFSEETHRKGFVWVDIERGKTSYKFVEVDARKYTTIKVDVRGARRPTDAILAAIRAADIERAVVRIIIDADYGVPLHTQDITELLESMDVYIIHSVNIKRDNPVMESRLGDRPIASLTELELLNTFWELTNKFSKGEVSVLTALAVDVMEEAALEEDYHE